MVKKDKDAMYREIIRDVIYLRDSAREVKNDLNNYYQSVSNRYTLAATIGGIAGGLLGPIGLIYFVPIAMSRPPQSKSDKKSGNSFKRGLLFKSIAIYAATYFGLMGFNKYVLFGKPEYREVVNNAGVSVVCDENVLSGMYESIDVENKLIPIAASLTYGLAVNENKIECVIEDKEKGLKFGFKVSKDANDETIKETAVETMAESVVNAEVSKEKEEFYKRLKQEREEFLKEQEARKKEFEARIEEEKNVRTEELQQDYKEILGLI